jgi:pyruvate/2-oxoglutarate dehydrogenase complex dihydrolipoamide dehydrogenase (E3) component
VPGLRELPGMWTNRQATSMTEVPLHLLVVGGGPVGVEMAQAVVRLGGTASIIEGMDHLLHREPRPLGEALGTALAAEGVGLHFGQMAAAAHFEDGEFVLAFPELEPLRGPSVPARSGPSATQPEPRELPSSGATPRCG